MATMRSTPPLPIPKGSYYPPNDRETYRDLRMFEDRLKSNAAFLNRRKSRYQLFLAQLLAIIIFLMSEVMLRTSFLTIPYKYMLRKALPEIYLMEDEVHLHPYFASGLLTVAVTTLLLFFASGMYAEKIGYANRYVPHANRALRNFNMHLNLRQRPLRSRLSLYPLSLFSGESKELYKRSSSRTPSPDRVPSRPLRKRGTSVPIPPIPPSTNPRGELIFSSRVDRSFRESYERYRAAFERMREERERHAAARTWYGMRLWPWNWHWRNEDMGPDAAYLRGGSPANSAVSKGGGTGTDNTPLPSRRPSPARMAAGKARGSGRGSRNASLTPTRSPIDRLRTEGSVST